MKIKEYYKEASYIHYSNCHEDVDLLIDYFPKDATNVLSIGSGLDNSLAFLTFDNVKVKSFDFNPTQVYLQKLKKAAIKLFSYNDFLVFLGIKDGDSLTLYNKLSNELELDVKEYFDEHLFLIDEIKLVHCGRFEYYFQVFKNKVFPKVVSKRRMAKFMELENLPDQINYYNKYINNCRFKLMFKIFFSKFVMSKVGRDKEYFKYNKGSLSKALKERFELGIKHNLNKDNPYLNYVLLNEFKALPYYLKKDNFDKIKANIDNIEIYQSSFDEMLNGEKYDFMNLSDIFEYMSADVMQKYSDLIAEHLSDCGRVAFWNMMNERKLFLKRINDIKDLERDKAVYYKDFLVYEKKYD